MADFMFTLRPAGRGDFPAMKAVLSDTFKRTWLPEITPSAATHYIETDIGGAFIDKNGLDMTVADVGGAIAGLIFWRDDFVDAVHVAEAFQGKGIGKALMAHAEKEMKRAGFAQSRLETDTFNERSHAVYRSLGYAEKDRYPDDEWDSGFTTILFVKKLG